MVHHWIVLFDHMLLSVLRLYGGRIVSYSLLSLFILTSRLPFHLILLLVGTVWNNASTLRYLPSHCKANNSADWPANINPHRERLVRLDAGLEEILRTSGRGWLRNSKGHVLSIIGMRTEN